MQFLLLYTWFVELVYTRVFLIARTRMLYRGQYSIIIQMPKFAKGIYNW